MEIHNFVEISNCVGNTSCGCGEYIVVCNLQWPLHDHQFTMGGTLYAQLALTKPAPSADIQGSATIPGTAVARYRLAGAEK